MSRGFVGRVDENIGKRCRGVADVCAPLKCIEELPDHSVNCGHVVIGQRIAVFVQGNRFGIYGGVVGFVIDYKQRDAGNPLATADASLSADAEPLPEIIQDALVFLTTTITGSFPPGMTPI